MKEKVETVLKEISRKAGKSPSDIKSATDSQGSLHYAKCPFIITVFKGTTYLLRSSKFSNAEGFALEGSEVEDDCNK